MFSQRKFFPPFISQEISVYLLCLSVRFSLVWVRLCAPIRALLYLNQNAVTDGEFVLPALSVNLIKPHPHNAFKTQ